MLGGRPARDQPANNAGSNRGLSGSAFDFFISPVNLFRRIVSGGNASAAANQPEIGMFGGANSNMEISRLSLHYSSANLSEEESSSLINILDRKKYHERLSATRSAEEQMQPRYVPVDLKLIFLTIMLTIFSFSSATAFSKRSALDRTLIVTCEWCASMLPVLEVSKMERNVSKLSRMTMTHSPNSASLSPQSISSPCS